jgi:hypothetical protein
MNGPQESNAFLLLPETWGCSCDSDGSTAARLQAIDRVRPTRRVLLMSTPIYVTASYTETIHFFLFLFSDYLVSRELIIAIWGTVVDP